MKFDCDKGYEEKYRRLTDWHPFFALWPRQVGSHDCRFLEWIERRGRWLGGYSEGFWQWEYRAKQSPKNIGGIVNEKGEVFIP